jgi:hypothetical protein
MIKSCFAAAILAILFSSASTHAGAVSELDVKGFEKETKAAGTVEQIKNPFTPSRPSPQDLAPEDIYLTGVVIGDGNRYALINGYIFTEGEEVAGLTIKSISGDRVVLQHLDKIQTLYLGGGF